MVMSKMPKNAEKYICEDCNFKCSKLSNYNTHLLTAKHKMITNGNNKMPKNAKAFVCDCGKEYNFSSGLSRHKKKCQKISQEKDTLNNGQLIEQKGEPTNDQLMIALIEKFADKDKLNRQLIEQNGELIQKIQQLGPTVVNNSNNNNCNNTYNVQMFLNEKCKDAINMQDFVNSIELTTKDLVAVGRDGYVDSITNVLIKALEKLDITTRPLHCTDLKRETIYIKNEEQWKKSDNKIMNKTIDIIQRKHYSIADNEYVLENPRANEIDSKDWNFCQKVKMTLLDEDQDENNVDRRNKKIFKKVYPTVKLNKGDM